MIGKYCRHFSEIIKDADANGQVSLIFCETRKTTSGLAIRAKNGIAILNHYISNVGNEFIDCLPKDIQELYSMEFGHCIYLGNKRDYDWFTKNLKTIKTIIILPNDFASQYANFYKCNKKQIDNLFSKLHTDFKHSEVQWSFCLCGNSINFFTWLVKNLYNNVNLFSLHIVMQWNNKYSYLVNKLTKGTITAYQGNNDICHLIAELDAILSVKRANDSIVQFNTVQKKLLREQATSHRAIETLNKFNKLSPSKQTNFIRKMSTVESYDEIMQQMEILCEIHFRWDKASFMKYLANTKGLHYEIASDNGNFVVLKVFDYETVKRLGKTTNWCISKNKSYWNNYIECGHPRHQMMIFNFDLKEDDEYSIVGFTIDSQYGIMAAHSFTNQDMMNSEPMLPIPQFVNATKNGIKSLLFQHHINLGKYLIPSCFNYKWEKNAMLSYLATKCPDGDIIQITDYRVVVDFQKSKQILAMFKNTTNFKDAMYFHCLLFFDFTKPEQDDTCLICALIEEDGKENERFSMAVDARAQKTNISFSRLLNDFNVPYDILHRPSNYRIMFIDALKDMDVFKIKTLLNNPHCLETLLKQPIKQDECDALIATCISYDSSAIVDAIYECGVKLHDIFDRNIMSNFIRNVTDRLVNVSFEKQEEPTLEEYQALLISSNNSINLCRCIGLWHILQNIIYHETNSHLFNQLTSRLLAKNRCATWLIQSVIKMILDKDNSKSIVSASIEIIAQLTVKYNMPTFFMHILPLCADDSIRQSFLDYAKSNNMALSMHSS